MIHPNNRLVVNALVTTAIMLACLSGVPQSFAQVQSAQQNSTRKIRVTPNAQSRRIGSAIKWQPDFEAAVAKSNQTGKPIFWYVPTLRGSFMDRKNEIDRYMLAGPFPGQTSSPSSTNTTSRSDMRRPKTSKRSTTSCPINSSSQDSWSWQEACGTRTW